MFMHVFHLFYKVIIKSDSIFVMHGCNAFADLVTGHLLPLSKGQDHQLITIEGGVLLHIPLHSVVQEIIGPDRH